MSKERTLQSYLDCEETHSPITIERLEKVYNRLNRRYWMFLIGLVISAMGVSIALGLYNYFLGAACFLAEIGYITYVNVINISNTMIRIKEVLHYMNYEVVGTKRDYSITEHNRGQYL